MTTTAMVTTIKTVAISNTMTMVVTLVIDVIEMELTFMVTMDFDDYVDNGHHDDSDHDNGSNVDLTVA